jgi:hypothetical protein
MNHIDVTIGKNVLRLDHSIVKDLGPVHVELDRHLHKGRH